jgi:hypothetical protein
MLCYTGVRNARIYLDRKCKRTAWRAYMRVNNWWYDLSGLKHAHVELFRFWDDDYYWECEDAFFDDNQ